MGHNHIYHLNIGPFGGGTRLGQLDTITIMVNISSNKYDVLVYGSVMLERRQSQCLVGTTGERGWGGCVMPITNVRMSVVSMMLSPFF